MLYSSPGDVNELLRRLLRSTESCFTATVNRSSQDLSCFSIALWNDLSLNNAWKRSGIQETWAFYTSQARWFKRYPLNYYRNMRCKCVILCIPPLGEISRKKNVFDWEGLCGISHAFEIACLWRSLFFFSHSIFLVIRDAVYGMEWECLFIKPELQKMFRLSSNDFFPPVVVK